MAKHPRIRDLIKDAQRILGVEADGLPGPNTESALQALMEDQINPPIRPPVLVNLLLEYLRKADQPWMYLRHAAPDQTPKIHSPRILPSKKPIIDPCAAPWLDWVLGHLGEKEDDSEASNPFIDALWGAIGIKWDHTTDIDSKVPWCAALVGAALFHTGYPHTASGLARSYLSYGMPIQVFRRGCILIWPRGSNPRAGHVDLGITLEDGIVETVGGNVKNQVALGKRPIKEAIGMRMPIPLAREAA